MTLRADGSFCSSSPLLLSVLLDSFDSKLVEQLDVCHRDQKLTWNSPLDKISLPYSTETGRKNPLAKEFLKKGTS